MAQEAAEITVAADGNIYVALFSDSLVYPEIEDESLNTA